MNDSVQRLPLSDRQTAYLLAMMIAIMPFSVDAYLPAVPQIAEVLHADIHHIERSLGSFILGVALGQLCGGSLSDIKGRKNIALIGLSIYILGTLALIFVQTANQLFWLRLIQAVGAGMSSVVVGAVVRDNYQGKQAAQMFAFIGIIMMAAPSLSPMIGSLLQGWLGWRFIFVFLLLYASLLTFLLVKFIPKRKQSEPLTNSMFVTILARYQRILATKPALGLLFFQAASFSSMLVFITESPFVYMKLYGLTEHQYAWAFGGNIITMALFNRVTAWHLKRDSDPQDILRWGIIIQLCANSMLAVAAWNRLPTMVWMLSWVMISIGTQGLIVANTQALFMEFFREESGSANALLLATQSLVAATAGFMATFLHDGTAHVMTGLMLTCTVGGIILLLTFSRHVFTNKRKNG